MVIALLLLAALAEAVAIVEGIWGLHAIVVALVVMAAITWWDHRPRGARSVGVAQSVPEAAPRAEMGMDEVLDVIGDARVVFWICPNDSHRFVKWRRDDDGKMVPRCLECGMEGEPR